LICEKEEQSHDHELKDEGVGNQSSKGKCTVGQIRTFEESEVKQQEKKLNI